MDPFFGNEKKYYSLFNSDSVEKLNCFYSIGNYAKNEFVYAYTYDNNYRYIIREIKLFNNLTPHKTLFQNKFFIKEADFDVATGFSLGNGPEVDMKSKTCLIRIHGLKINFGSFNEIEKSETANAVIYKGKFSQFGITDENDIYQIFTTFKDNLLPTSVLILLKKNDSFFIILVNSVKSEFQIDDGIKLLKLN